MTRIEDVSIVRNPPFTTYPHTKLYLGDGAFLSTDGFSLWLTTENGIDVTNQIALEPEVALALLRTIKTNFPTLWSAANAV